MGKSNAQRQAEYQRRQSEARNHRLDVYISDHARAALEHIAEREGCTRKDAVEQLIRKGAETMQFRRDDPTLDPKGTAVKNPYTTGLTLDELRELKEFEASLPEAAINTRLDQREHQANGGDAGRKAKEAFEAQINACNIHRR